MASLTSAGVSVTVIDESQYTTTATGTVAYILVASAQDKLNPSGSLATYTTKANAGTVFSIASQRELIQYFGNPTFQVDAADNALHGDERNEYGLLAAYSALGAGGRVLIQRADIDLNQLKGTGIRPTGTPVNGTYWLDLNNTDYGIYEWQDGGFAKQTITSITDTRLLTGSAPNNSYGKIGDYAINAHSTSNPVYYKTSVDNTWVLVGSSEWQMAHPTIIGTVSNPANLQIGQKLTINSYEITITGSTVSAAVQDINGVNIQGVLATESPTGELEIRINNTSASSGNISLPDGILSISAGTTGPDAAIELGLLGLNGESVTMAAPVAYFGSYVEAPAWRDTDVVPRPHGSVWVKTSAKGSGANWALKKYSTALKSWEIVTVPLYVNDSSAILDLDPAGGGGQLPIGTIFLRYNLISATNSGLPQLTFKPLIKQVSGALKVTGVVPTQPLVFTNNTSFIMKVSVPGSVDVTATITLNGTTSEAFVEAIQRARLPNIAAFIEASGAISISHLAGGTMKFIYLVGTPLVIAGITAGTQAACAQYVQMQISNSQYLASPFEPLVYVPSHTVPYSYAADGTLWYNSDPTAVDIMIHDGSGWKGYLNVTNDARGYNLTNTNPTGIIISSTQPTAQTDSSALVPGDLWLDTSDLENYPRIYRYSGAGWNLIDNNDDTSSDGIIFADARWGDNENIDPVVGDLPSTSSTLLNSNYLDPDAPNYRLYPRGALLFNTRRSGYNVKRFESNWFSNYTPAPAVVSSWVSQSGVNAGGVPYFGHKAQRNTVVEALAATVGASTSLREEQVSFNLISCPGYPELLSELVVLNNDRKQTAFIIGDSPMDLGSSSQSLLNWSKNANNSVDNAVGLSTHSEYLGIYYPSGYTVDLKGNGIVVPPSHMMLRTIIRSDNASYPWFAPAGVRRGIVDNAQGIGYIDRMNDNRFVSIGLTNTLRDVLYENAINPITVLPGTGIVAYGQKTCTLVTSSMDRVNVSRLVCYLRGVLDAVARPYIFEPNDAITRKQIQKSFESVLNDLVAKRGITDYAVRCDDSNNTSDRIARNELWIDIAIEPTRAVEFVYIPIRLKNPGAIQAG